jgi:hypothetical protein
LLLLLLLVYHHIISDDVICTFLGGSIRSSERGIDASTPDTSSISSSEDSVIVMNVKVNVIDGEGRSCFNRSSYEKKQRRPQLTSHLLVECCKYQAVIAGGTVGMIMMVTTLASDIHENTHHSKQRRHDVVVAQLSSAQSHQLKMLEVE